MFLHPGALLKNGWRYTFLMVVVLSAFFGGCDTRSCENVICGQRQICVNGVCRCTPGYEGDNCDILSADKFVGNYQVTENCASNPGNNYTSWIDYGSEINKVIINNILGIGLSAEAYIDGDFIEIPSQNVGATTIAGTGLYRSTPTPRIEINYDYTQGSTLYNCKAIFFKQ